jgi:V/A-type H+-transporting ATPase subunit I
MSIFELLDVLLTFITNSMSYLRVGGFVLSHAGMMLVVMTLVKMTGGAGPVVLVLGNLFVMGLEGLIVGIQTLRLEYYEMFSRYYDAGGTKFTALTAESAE